MFVQLWLVPMLNCWMSITDLPGAMEKTTRYSRLERVPCSPGSKKDKKERWKKAVGFGFQPPDFTTSCHMTRNAGDLSFNDESER